MERRGAGEGGQHQPSIFFVQQPRFTTPSPPVPRVPRLVRAVQSGVAEVAGFSWHGPRLRGNTGDGAGGEDEDEGPPPDFGRLLDLARNASAVYSSADEIIDMYHARAAAAASAAGGGSGLVRSTHALPGGAGAAAAVPGMVRSLAVVASWPAAVSAAAGGPGRRDGVTVVDAPGVGSRMLVHRVEALTAAAAGATGSPAAPPARRVVRLVVAFQGTANLKNALADLEYAKVVDPTLSDRKVCRCRWRRRHRAACHKSLRKRAHRKAPH